MASQHIDQLLAAAPALDQAALASIREFGNTDELNKAILDKAVGPNQSDQEPLIRLVGTLHARGLLGDLSNLKDAIHDMLDFLMLTSRVAPKVAPNNPTPEAEDQDWEPFGKLINLGKFAAVIFAGLLPHEPQVMGWLDLAVHSLKEMRAGHTGIISDGWKAKASVAAT